MTMTKILNPNIKHDVKTFEKRCDKGLNFAKTRQVFIRLSKGIHDLPYLLQSVNNRNYEKALDNVHKLLGNGNVLVVLDTTVPAMHKFYYGYSSTGYAHYMSSVPLSAGIADYIREKDSGSDLDDAKHLNTLYHLDRFNEDQLVDLQLHIGNHLGLYNINTMKLVNAKDVRNIIKCTIKMFKLYNLD